MRPVHVLSALAVVVVWGQAIFTILFAALALGERFGPLRLVGMGLVLLGLAVLVTAGRDWDMIAAHDD